MKVLITLAVLVGVCFSISCKVGSFVGGIGATVNTNCENTVVSVGATKCKRYV